jgi:hypothetical protein
MVEQTPGCTRTGSVVRGKRLRLVIRLFWLGVLGCESRLTEDASDLTKQRCIIIKMSIPPNNV